MRHHKNGGPKPGECRILKLHIDNPVRFTKKQSSYTVVFARNLKIIQVRAKSQNKPV